MNNYLRALIIFTLSIGYIGCSSNPTSNSSSEIVNQQESQKQTVIGMYRSDFLKKVDTPISSKFIGDKRVDTFAYHNYKGMTKSKLFGFAFYNSFIAGLAPFDSLKEKISIPKSAIQGDRVVIQVIYDSSDRIEKIERVK